MKIKLLSSFFIVALVLSYCLIGLPQNAQAVSASDWRAGRIIDDAIFFNKDSMSIEQIQNFLNAKVPNCDRWNPTRFSYAGKPYGPPYTCLKEYQENPTTHENNIGRFNANGTPYNVPGGWSAAQIIKDAANSYNINPQVLIVMLQKETAIVTDTWSAGWQYDRAMGYGCPDSGPNGTANCNNKYYGFYNQVGNAAWQLRRYVTYPDQYNFKAGVTRNILWQVGGVCGSAPVYLENAATAALYNYTPYQPNQAALNNMYGTGDRCSAYGNRNFWRMFNDWFGSTTTNCYGASSSGYGIYRLYNKSTGGTFLTTNGCEARNATSAGFMYDGQIFQSNSSGTPVFRMVRNGSYLYTVTENELKAATQQGYRLEGIAFRSFSSGKPVYRLSHPSGGYQYTISDYEKIHFMSIGYKLDGVIFYAQENPNNSVSATYRLAHPNGVYLYTTSQSEKNAAVQYYGYRLEGAGFNAITQMNKLTIPMYRLASNTSYLYTTSLAERVHATNLGFRDEGIAMFTYGAQGDPKLTPIYRLAGKSGGYLYTSSYAEVLSAVNRYGYRLEGLAFRTP